MYKTCKLSAETFEISSWEQEFYTRQDLPIPELAPARRMQQRLAFRNEASLYKRRCDGSGRQIVSMYSADKPHKVYDNDYWWSDNWDALQYGRDFDFNRTFFEQYAELLVQVPKMARIQQGSQENSTFCNCSANNKNCFLLFSASNNEDCLYGRTVNFSKNSLDCFGIYWCELCYECVQCEHCYDCKFSENCKNCSASWFLKNCIGCSDCFGCINLRNKSFHWFNEPLSKQEYQKRISGMSFHDQDQLKRFRRQFDEYAGAFPAPYLEGVGNENVSGNYIINSKNAWHCFDVANLEDCMYCDNLTFAKDCCDVSFYGATEANELLYQCEGVGHGVYDVFCSKLIWGGSRFVRYSYECFSCEEIFGCCGLKKSKYCILNKQYEKREFLALATRIKAHMKKTGEWGRFFPLELSPFAYNETLAAEYFPLSKAEVLHRGWRWNDLASQEAFRIEKIERDFYQSAGLPEPIISPVRRHLNRVSRRTARALQPVTCACCNRAVLTALPSSRQGRILCQECYQSAAL